MAKIRSLECCVCGESAGRFEQWWNRDTGYGVCRRCIDRMVAKGETAEEIRDLYGVEGVNYAAPIDHRANEIAALQEDITRYTAAEEPLRTYTAAMADLGLKPLNWIEIGDQLHLLRHRLARRIET